jgi:hypothetical protein
MQLEPRFAEAQAQAIKERQTGRFTMSSKSTRSVHGLVLLAMMSITPIPAARDDDGDIMSFSRQFSAASTLSAAPPLAPMILAQGRCYNGRCY